MTSRRRSKLLQNREEGVARVQRQVNDGQLVVDRTTIDPYEGVWEKFGPLKPTYPTTTPEIRLLAAGTFANDAPTVAQRKRGLPHHPWRAVGAAGSDVTPNGKTVQQLHANVQFHARSAVAEADWRYAFNLARYEMRMELHRAYENRNDSDNPGRPMGLGQHERDDRPERREPKPDENLDSTSDEESYARPDDGLYYEWLC
ncbi:MAG: hypothetical protein M1839_001779 [Geoglossum umbratile]|nr:MAG: hypothetical protein M1839_001779 [Geoglossum umbratile]